MPSTFDASLHYLYIATAFKQYSGAEGADNSIEWSKATRLSGLDSSGGGPTDISGLATKAALALLQIEVDKKANKAEIDSIQETTLKGSGRSTERIPPARLAFCLLYTSPSPRDS